MVVIVTSLFAQEREKRNLSGRVWTCGWGHRRRGRPSMRRWSPWCWPPGSPRWPACTRPPVRPRQSPASADQIRMTEVARHSLLPSLVTGGTGTGVLTSTDHWLLAGSRLGVWPWACVTQPVPVSPSRGNCLLSLFTPSNLGTNLSLARTITRTFDFFKSFHSYSWWMDTGSVPQPETLWFYRLFFLLLPALPSYLWF